MGPLLFRAEDQELDRDDRGRILLQWGRSCSERKTIRRPLRLLAEIGGFNGAALVQSGRPVPMRRWTRDTWCFNGAALVQSGRRRDDYREVLLLLTLQWGRSCSERKTGECGGEHYRHNLASMGPLLFRAEDAARASESDPGDWPLQWGRSCSERKTVPRPRTTPAPSRFNGAALVQSGRRGSWSITEPPRSACFNGAALVQSGRLQGLSPV